LDLSIQNFIRKTEHCLGQEQFLPALESLEQAQHLYSNAPRTLIDYRTEHNIARAKRQIQPLLRAFRGLPEERRVKQLAEWIDGSGGTLLLPTTENADQDGSVEHSADEREAAFMPTAGRLCGLQSSYGFIDANGSRLFFHRGDWNGHIDYLALGEGHPVEFELGSNHKGPCAVRVRPAGTSKGPVAVSHIGHVALLESTFGFIERSGGTRIFFHRTTCAEGTQFKSLQVGERVRFTVGVGNDGRPCAGDVERYSGM
jgi:cold shock CspA family protein